MHTLDGRTDGRTNGRTDGPTDGHTDGRTHGRTDGRADEHAYMHTLSEQSRGQGVGGSDVGLRRTPVGRTNRRGRPNVMNFRALCLLNQ